MAEYIEREALLCMVRPDDPSDEKAAITIATAKKLIRSLACHCPVADVAPVRHGRWEKAQDMRRMDGNIYDYRCSLCDSLAEKGVYNNYDKLTNYCPNCGAKMDGGTN